MRTKKKRKKKKSGNSGWPVSVSRLLLSVLLLFGLAHSLSAPAAGAGKKNKQQGSFAIVSGTVFRDPGFAMGGARVTMVPDPQTDKPVKAKKLKIVSDARGEFAFRVPPVPMRYSITVEADGYQSQQKPVQVQAEERVEVYFTLQPVPR